MAFIVTFNHLNEQRTFITNENEARYSILRGFHLLISELGDDSDRINEAQDEIVELDLNALQAYRFTTDPRAYRSELKFKEILEIPYDQFSILYQHAEILDIYCN